MPPRGASRSGRSARSGSTTISSDDARAGRTAQSPARGRAKTRDLAPSKPSATPSKSRRSQSRAHTGSSGTSREEGSRSRSTPKTQPKEDRSFVQRLGDSIRSIWTGGGHDTSSLGSAKTLFTKGPKAHAAYNDRFARDRGFDDYGAYQASRGLTRQGQPINPRDDSGANNPFQTRRVTQEFSQPQNFTYGRPMGYGALGYGGPTMGSMMGNMFGMPAYNNYMYNLPQRQPYNQQRMGSIQDIISNRLQYAMPNMSSIYAAQRRPFQYGSPSYGSYGGGYGNPSYGGYQNPYASMMSNMFRGFF